MKQFLFTMLMGVSVCFCSAQYWEAGAFIGTSSYKGDLRVDYFTPNNYHLAVGLIGKYRISPSWAIQASATRGQISGSDAHSPYESERVRNLSFRSHIYEFSGQIQYYIGKFDLRDGKISAPYVFAGVGMFHFNPQTDRFGKWFDLQPLGTEGQGTDLSGQGKYRLLQMSIPFGIGWQISLGGTSNIGLELGMRKTFTDFLDDVSGYYPDVEKLAVENPQAAALAFRSPEYYDAPMDNPVGTPRGNASNKDWYFMFGMTITTNLADKYKMEFDEKYKIFGE